MERLTERYEDSEIIYSNPTDPEGMYDILDLARFADSGDGTEANILLNISKRLAAYEDAEEQGWLVVLPVKPGQKVFALEKKFAERKPSFVRERVVNSYGISTDGYINMQLMDVKAFNNELSPTGYARNIFWEIDKIGKTVFLTHEEAEAALKECEGE